VLLLMSVAVALLSLVLLWERGQRDLPAAVAVTWLLGAPIIVLLGRRSAAGKPQQQHKQQQLKHALAAGDDALVVVGEAEAEEGVARGAVASPPGSLPSADVLAAFHGTWIKVRALGGALRRWSVLCCGVGLACACAGHDVGTRGARALTDTRWRTHTNTLWRARTQPRPPTTGRRRV
jgi:hypothetical protein